MNQKGTRIKALFAMSIGLAFVLLFSAEVQSAQASDLHLEGTPPPAVTPTPGPAGGGDAAGSGSSPVRTTVTNIFYHLRFPAETISAALGKVFTDAAGEQSSRLAGEAGIWYQIIGEILQPPGAGEYARVAQSSWPVAATLAPALFILRIALYHWNRLMGEEDSAMRAAGDILTALVLAVLCGWFLDLMVRLGWWMTGAALGETGALAIDFVRSMSVEGVIQGLLGSSNSMMLGILFMAVELGAVLAIAGMLMAFAAANAGLFLLAVMAPSIAVASALPQMRWMRFFWFKALTLIAILPLVAGAIFKASTFMAGLFTTGGILALFIRILWLWGATGAMLSLAGILGKLTISTSTDAVGQLINAVKGIATTAALVASGAGALGAVGGLAGGAAGGAEGAGVGGASAGLAAGGGEAAGGGGLASASAQLGAAQAWNNRSVMYEAFGLGRPAQFARSLSASHSLAARRAELSARMDQFGGEEKTDDDLGFEASGGVRKELLESFGGNPRSFHQAYGDLSPMLKSHGINPSAFASQYPGHAGLMARIYSAEREAIDRSPDPLSDLAGRAGAPKNLFGL
jgi:hypothetical protein